eukprot:12298881-Ditylum_brightwellii.AAC.1
MKRLVDMVNSDKDDFGDDSLTEANEAKMTWKQLHRRFGKIIQACFDCYINFRAKEQGTC